MAANMASSSGSGSRGTALKNSATASTSRPARMGNPTPERRPCCWVTVLRGRFWSLARSAIQTGSPALQTRPGSPTPGAKVRRMEMDSYSETSAPGACQVCTQRNRFHRASTVHSAPVCNSRLSQTARSSWGAASASEGDSDKARVAASSVRNRLSSIRRRSRLETFA